MARDPEADVLAELLLTLTIYRSEYGVVKSGAAFDVAYLDGNVIQPALPQWSCRAVSIQTLPGQAQQHTPV
ncbi:hypothetical protein [Streptomyces sp. NPDC048248]|uniref:hypothetical protein n=1 Tax=Streptomyces sp. NPDC048248 TaxID=3365523 RepID=UPI0037183A89